MPDPDALWKDIQKLDDMYEELLWHPDDEGNKLEEYIGGMGITQNIRKVFNNYA